jgi:hypothetical protein
MGYVLRAKKPKSLVEKTFYSKDDTILVFSEGFTGGEWRFMQDDSELEEYIPPLDDDEIDMTSYYEFEMTGSGPGHSDHWSFEGEKNEDLMKQAEAILHSDGRDGLEDGGWEYEDTEWFVYGGLELIKD